MSRGANGVAGGGRDPAPATGESGAGGDNPRFRATLLRVLVVQVVTLALLWFLQAAYHG